ncbi:evasin P467-like isoform X1 [Rhipicephalus microplus]|uniref:Evasin n=1 Tax=Rhipicephalus microplus TaxID=6941 RepID=A0A6G5A5D3_RHIMP
MAFKACITAIAVAYVVQTLCGADSSSESSGSGSSDEDYQSSCLYHIMKTADNRTLSVNCTLDCGQHQNDSMPCVNATDPMLNYTSHQNYSCTVGFCHNGTCPSNGTRVTCWTVFFEGRNEDHWETSRLQL